ncbi:ty3-gypsy retrotransposon protein [Tanacetum coccineum]
MEAWCTQTQVSGSADATSFISVDVEAHYLCMIGDVIIRLLGCIYCESREDSRRGYVEWMSEFVVRSDHGSYDLVAQSRDITAQVMCVSRDLWSREVWQVTDQSVVNVGEWMWDISRECEITQGEGVLRSTQGEIYAHLVECSSVGVRRSWIAALQADLKATKGLMHAGPNGDGGETASPIPRSMKLDVPKFSGTDPDQWFRWMTRNNLITTWDGFLESVQNRFGPCEYENPQGALSKLLQKGAVAQYQGEFEKLLYRVTDVSDGLLISFYISGLKPTIQLELLVSKPTSLGDAFALARVTEARLDGRRVSIVSQATTVASGGRSQRTQSSRISAASSQLAAVVSQSQREQLSKGFCFNCDNLWVCGHKCPGKVMTDEKEDTEPVTEAIQEDALKGGDISILNSLVGYGSPRSLQLWGVLGAGKKGISVRQVLVQWSGRPPEEATWEWLSEFQEAYPSYHLEDKVIYEGEKNVMPGLPRSNQEDQVQAQARMA